MIEVGRKYKKPEFILRVQLSFYFRFSCSTSECCGCLPTLTIALRSSIEVECKMLVYIELELSIPEEKLHHSET